MIWGAEESFTAGVLFFLSHCRERVRATWGPPDIGTFPAGVYSILLFWRLGTSPPICAGNHGTVEGYDASPRHINVGLGLGISRRWISVSLLPMSREESTIVCF